MALVASLLVIVAGPAAAEEPALTVTPSEDLVDRQLVDVVATGFVPEAPWGAAVCDTEVLGETQDITGCDLSNTVFGFADSNGGVVSSLLVRRFITVAGDIVDCAEPGRCILAGATLGDDLLSPLDPAIVATAALSFDPDVPGVPPLDVDLLVDEVTESSATGTITCNRPADAFVELVIEQIRRSSSAFAAGFAELGCDTDPTPFEVEIETGQGRFHAGDAPYSVFASAFDEFEFASEQVEGEVRIGNSSPPTPARVDEPGLTVAVTGFEGATDRGQMGLAVDVECTVASTLQINVGVEQFAGFDRVFGSGFVSSVPCDGPTTILVPISDDFGAIVAGPAKASVWVWSSDDAQEIFDFASASGPVVLRGRSTDSPFGPPPPNPDSTISIGSYADGVLSGAIECPAGATAFVDATVIQEHGRTRSFGSGFEQLVCTGDEQAFAVTVFGDGLRNGPASVVVNGFAFEVTPEGEFIVLYDDYQAGDLRIR